jgi:16S rRNA (cytidine1402-2'-O)-methyltransferase
MPAAAPEDEEATRGTLYVVSTPIGNMGDLTHRAVKVLGQVDVVLAEDTRHTRHLLRHYEIHTPLTPYHEHNEAATAPALVKRLGAGASMALVTDAGTPLVSDPGARLVRAAIQAGVNVVPVPGASALLAALVASGLDATRFTFYGFLPRGGAERRAAIEEISALAHTAVLYEAPGRLGATLDSLAEACDGGPDRDAVVAREITKQFEELRRGTLGELAAYYKDEAPRGEIVVLVSGAPAMAASDDAVREQVRAALARGLSTRDAAAEVARSLGVPRRTAYRMAQEER